MSILRKIPSYVTLDAVTSFSGSFSTHSSCCSVARDVDLVSDLTSMAPVELCVFEIRQLSKSFWILFIEDRSNSVNDIHIVPLERRESLVGINDVRISIGGVSWQV